MSIEQELSSPQYRSRGFGFYADTADPQRHTTHHHSDIELFLFLNANNAQITWEQNSKSHASQTIQSQQLYIIPSELEHSIDWYQPIEYIIIFISPSLLLQTAENSISNSSFQLMGQYGIQDSLLQSLMITLGSALEIEGMIEHLYVDTLINTLLVCLLKRYAGCQFIAAHEHPIQNQQWLKTVLEFIHQSLDQDLRLGKLAHLANMSESSFCHLFKEYMNISPHQYVIQSRIALAKELLLKQQMSIAEIAVCCGFNSQSHLTSYFRQHTGMTPKAYQQST